MKAPLSVLLAVGIVVLTAEARADEDIALKHCGPIPSLDAPGNDEVTVKGGLNLDVEGLIKAVKASLGLQAEETKKKLYNTPDIYYAGQKDKYVLRMFCAALWEDSTLSPAERRAAWMTYYAAPGTPATGLAATPKPVELHPKRPVSSYAMENLTPFVNSTRMIPVKFVPTAMAWAEQIHLSRD